MDQQHRPVTQYDGNGSRGLTYVWARRIAVALVGGTVLLAGIAMTVLPGPAIVVIPAGLAILGIEFAWARRWLKTVKAKAQGALSAMKRGTASEPNVRAEASRYDKAG